MLSFTFTIRSTAWVDKGVGLYLSSVYALVIGFHRKALLRRESLSFIFLSLERGGGGGGI